MIYTNSPLVSYTKISPNRTKVRNHVIDTITIHCVEGQCTVESLGAVFDKVTRRASSNYGVGYDGKIGMYVEEKDRSWCSSSAANDHRAITIEVASDTKPPYAVTDKAYAALIELVVDICKRNNIKQLLWKADKSLIGQPDKQNLTVHRWFADTSCPGEYLYSRMGAIANAVNKKLEEYERANGDKIYRVQIGAYKTYAEAEKMLAKARAAGFDDAYITNAISIATDTDITAKSEEQPTAIKSVDEIAKEVIDGKWSTGSDRKNRLTAAGYDYATVQARVNELCK